MNVALSTGSLAHQETFLSEIKALKFISIELSESFWNFAKPKYLHSMFLSKTNAIRFRLHFIIFLRAVGNVIFQKIYE